MTAPQTPHTKQRWLLLLLPLGGGCIYDLIPESRICEDVAFGISERTLVCQDDADLANTRYHRFMDTATCLLPDEVTDPYNPEGILPASDNPEEAARLEGLYDCVRRVRTASCAHVAALGDDMSWWLSLEAGCASVATAPGDFPPAQAEGDTGGVQ